MRRADQRRTEFTLQFSHCEELRDEQAQLPRQAWMSCVFVTRAGNRCAAIAVAKLLADDVETSGRVDADANAVGSDANDCDLDVFADQNPLTRFTRQDKHGFTPFLGRSCLYASSRFFVASIELSSL